MKKVTDFIVDKKYYILVIVILLSCISLYLGMRVKINYDISKYLPNDSETRIGMDIMEENFDPIEESSLSVMFEDLDESKKEDIKEELEDIDGVTEVLYDDSSNYNKDEYTLYILNVDDVSDSKTAKKVYDSVNSTFKDYKFYLGGSIEDSNKPVLKFWIVILAVCFAMLILILMCDSYIEPFLFLFVILLAIGLNKGTNLIFNEVSHVTNAISAILQMALSMDYSIMLMNRYTQERVKEKDKNKAMKKALYNSFKSISSSSVTTIVGLLALVFMSFTIGRDLGFVLAKGVLFSLITIFLCLPALIILFDNLINKTKKKSLSISLDWLGKFSYKFRYVIVSLFLVLFGLAFALKGNLGILFTDIETDEIGKHFDENNQIAVIYNNKYEDDITKYCNNLDDDKIKNVLCYGNTIADDIKSEDLNQKFEDLGKDTNIDDYLLKLVYYNYYNDNSNKMSLNEFVTFVEKDIYTNENFNSHIDDSSKENLEKLKNFASKDSINQKRSSKELAKILGMDADSVDSLFILYNSKNTNTKIKLDDFINFLNKYVITNPKYTSSITNSNKALLKKVMPFTNKENNNKEMNAKELSSLFGISEDSISGLLLLNYINSPMSNKLSLDEFIIKTTFIKNNTNYLDDYDVSAITSLTPIASNQNNMNARSMTQAELSGYFSGVSPTLVDTVYGSVPTLSGVSMTPSEFIDFTLTNLGGNLDNQTKGKLQLLKLLIGSTLNQNSPKYSVSELSNLLSYDSTTINSLYALINVSEGFEIKVSPVNLINIILSNKDNPLISSSLDAETIKNLTMLKEVMDSINNSKYYSIKEMASFFNLGENDVKLIYSLYDITISKKNVSISLDNFISFILTDVVNDSKYSENFDSKSKLKLRYIQTIMNNSLKNKQYTSNELYTNLKNLSKNLDNNLIDLVYLYEGSLNDYNEKWTLTLENFVVYLHDEIINDDRFKDFIDIDMTNQVNLAYDDIKIARDMLKGDKYSRMIINTIYSQENQETFDFIQSIKDDLDSEGKEIYVIGDSPMAYDMSGSFNKELNFITILTMLFIFIVVAITFKSVIIPIVLVSIIQCAVYLTMGVMVVFGGSVYFIALLIVQSILMGATIDYAIVYTSYYKESRLTMDVKESIINAYNKSIHTILTSASILIIVTMIVGNFASAIAAKICKTLSQGTLYSALLILFVLPAVLVSLDKLIIKKKS